MYSILSHTGPETGLGCTSVHRFLTAETEDPLRTASQRPTIPPQRVFSISSISVLPVEVRKSRMTGRVTAPRIVQVSFEQDHRAGRGVSQHSVKKVIKCVHRPPSGNRAEHRHAMGHRSQDSVSCRSRGCFKCVSDQNRQESAEPSHRRTTIILAQQ